MKVADFTPKQRQEIEKILSEKSDPEFDFKSHVVDVLELLNQKVDKILKLMGDE